MSDEFTVPLPLLRRYLMFHGWQPAKQAVSTLDAFGAKSFANAFFQGRSGGQRNVDLYVLSGPGLNDVELVVPQTVA